MKPSLQIGISAVHRYTVPYSKTVPALYPESAHFVAMPAVFATGFMVGLLEWACILALDEHLDAPHEQSLGTHIDVSHCAPTPVGLEVTVHATLLAIDGRKLTFKVAAHDGIEWIASGRHERVVIDRIRFDTKVSDKAKRVVKSGFGSNSTKPF